MASKSKDIKDSKVDISKRIEQRVAELKASNSYDPRRENELNEIYDRYVPPHSMAQTSHLVDVAERDAYVDPFPPIASNKKAGVILKKGIRVGFGLYAQFLSQQISTFGSGVTRALRSIDSDVEELKSKVAAKKVPNFIYSLDLNNVDDKIFELISKSTNQLDSVERTIVSDSLDNSYLADLSKISDHLIVVDERAQACSAVDGEIDSRKQNISEFINKLEDDSIDLIILSGIINFYDLSFRLEVFDSCARVLKTDGQLIFVANTDIINFSSDQKCALDVLNTNILSASTNEKILNEYFSDIETGYCGEVLDLDQNGNTKLNSDTLDQGFPVTVFTCTNKS